MSDLRTAAQQALEALEYLDVTAENRVDDRIPDAAIKALRAALAEEALQRLSDANQEIEAALEKPDRSQKMRDAGYTRRPTLREMAALEQQEQEQEPWVKSYSGGKPNYTQPFTLSCGCPSQYGGVPAQWPDTDREGNPAVAHGVICERHWHEYRAHCPDCEPNKDDWK